MTERAFANDALLLVAHGSSRYPDAGRTLQLHAAALRTQAHFAEVGVGFLNGAPSVADALAELRSSTIHVVPFFMEDGYFTRVAVPQSLASGPPTRLYPPVGIHPGMTSLISARIQRERAGAADVILVGHGSAKSPGRRMALHDHAERLAARVAFLEEPPFLDDALAQTLSPIVAVLGVFAGEGGHVRDDLPALIAAARLRFGKRLIDLGSIGDDAGMAALILDRVAGGRSV